MASVAGDSSKESNQSVQTGKCHQSNGGDLSWDWLGLGGEGEGAGGRWSLAGVGAGLGVNR